MRVLLAYFLVACSTASAAEKIFVYSTPWCPACRLAKADMESEPGLAGGREVVRVDVERRPDLARKAGVTVLPTFVIDDDGEEVRRLAGYPGRNAFRRWASR